MSVTTDAELMRCVRERSSPSWVIIDAFRFRGDPVVQVRAPTSALEMEPRAVNAHPAHYVELSISRFKDYTALNPHVLPLLIESGAIERTESVRGIPARLLAPFTTYDMRDGAFLLVHGPGESYCFDAGSPPELRHVRCQLVSRPHTAAFNVSATRLSVVPSVFAGIREYLSRLRPCLD